MIARPRFRNPSVLALVLGFFVTLSASASAVPANTPPPESTSKIKRVLLYNKIGGWRATDAIAHVNQYMASLAQAKGFTLDTLSDETYLTLEFLKQYQVIIWNNNSNGAVSVPLASARQAVVDYVNQGGGWFLIGLAGDHVKTWPALTDMLGASFTRTGARGEAEMRADSAAQKHPELRFVLNTLPQPVRLTDIWVSFDRTVRPLPNVTVLYTSQNGATNVLIPPEDGSGDRAYVWARTIEKGKLLFCPPGWAPGEPNPMFQADSAVAKLYWNSMRWLAGDFQNGCTDPNSPLFNPEARVDDGSCSLARVGIDGRRHVRTSKRQLKPSRLQAPRVNTSETHSNHDVRGRILSSDRPQGQR